VTLGTDGGTTGSCTTDANCNDHNPCTIDTCVFDGTGETKQGVCIHKADPSCGTTSSSSTSTGGPIMMCPAGCAFGLASFPPAIPLTPPNLPATCANGFEMNNSPQGSFTAHAISPSGAKGGNLDVQIATYLAPDHIRITGVDASNNTYTIVDTCSMQTALYSDPTNGCTRPPDDSIRQYQVTVKTGTKSLTFDVSGGCTPHYLRVLGLCDFSWTAPIPGCAYRAIP
jgi:hypothetical protein